MRLPSKLAYVLIMSIFFPMLRTSLFHTPESTAKCVVLDAEATPDFYSAEIGGVASYVGAEALWLHVWMATTEGPEAGQIPVVGRMRLRIPTHSRNWTEAAPQYAPGTVHTCERHGVLQTLFHVQGAWHSSKGLGANEAGGFARQDLELWECFCVALWVCALPLLAYLAIAVLTDREISDALAVENFREMCKVSVYPISVVCALMIIALLSMQVRTLTTCKVLAVMPVGAHSFRIWAATDKGAAQFDYTTLDAYEIPDLMSLGADQSSVACAVSAADTHPREIFIQRYTGAIVSVQGSDDRSIRVTSFFDILLVGFFLALNAGYRPVVEYTLRREGIVMEKTISSEKARYADPRAN
jgi:hypothetical protein